MKSINYTINQRQMHDKKVDKKQRLRGAIESEGSKKSPITKAMGLQCEDSHNQRM
jgi:hypothetical protein